MSLFVNTSNLHNNYLDCCPVKINETIEQDCLSVLHKLHDQVNGLQLVQVVVQPLARLFNPANLAALVANTSSPQTSVNSNTLTNQTSSHSSATTPSSHHSSVSHHPDIDGSTNAVTTPTTPLAPSNLNSHSRGSSFVPGLGTGSANASASSGSFLSSSSTYMLSPDTAQALIARLDTDRDVNWLMEIIGYGLSMPFSLTGEQDSVKNCCTIYCEWLAAALLPYNESNEDSKYQRLSKLVPVPIRQDPNRYARKMLSHLYNVFLPRPPVTSTAVVKDQSDATLTAVSRQAVLCHRVLRTIENIAQNPQNLMDAPTWDHLLALLLTVNDKLLSAPTEPDDIGTQLHDRILGVLFELMLLASSRSIPSAGLWRTFHEMCLNWRHRPALVDHWRRITYLLTKRIVYVSSSTSRGGDRMSDNDNLGNPSFTKQTHQQPANLTAVELSIASMNYDNLSQTWYRFLHLIGNPVDLSDPDTISRTDEFYHSACASDNVLDPRQHPCLSVLPQVFMNSMSALRDFIETFLGTYEQAKLEQTRGELTTSDRNSQVQSSRASISSLSGHSLSTSSNANYTAQSSQFSNQQQPSQQQATTPTLSRRAGIKSLALKTNKTASSFNAQQSQALDPSPIHEHPKSGSTSSSSARPQQQFMQPRPSLTSLSSRTSQSENQTNFQLNPDRPKCNSILHLFGDWLFSAALIGSELSSEITDVNNDTSLSETATSASSLSTATEIAEDSRGPSPSSRRASTQTTSSQASASKNRQQDSTSGNFPVEKMTLDSPLSPDSFECGQAEAMAILCRIFSAKSTAEDICPTYLSRFYLCLQHCLTCGIGSEQISQANNQPFSPMKRQLLASVLVNSTELLQKDLDGINLLIPSLIKAIEFVLECSDREGPIQPPPRQHNRSMRRASVVNPNNVTNYDLRRACISTLVNLLAYPLHFQDLVIRNNLNDSSPTTTFELLRPRLLKMLFVALQTETDTINMQILFSGLSLAINDLSSITSKSSSSSSCNINSRRKRDSMSASFNNDDDSFQSSTDITHQDDSVSQSSFVFKSAGGFLIKSLHVTCHLLISIWKHDTQVSLAALEVLTTIARVSTTPGFVDNNNTSNLKSSYKLNNNNSHIEMKNEYMQTTKWICDYICNQCSRPPPAHSRDMHSTIVAAYQCLSVWIYNHPRLLEEINCVRNLIEVIELGVSGQKSRTSSINPTSGNSTEMNTAKGDKIMKPSSMRVREAAESLLNICMVTDSITKDGNLSLDTMVNEVDIANLFGGPQYKMNLRQVHDDHRQVEAFKLFKYFSDEDSIVLGLLESFNHDQTTKDSVICLLRTPFGKHCWKFKFNYYTGKSREKIIANKTLGLIKRPFTCTTPVTDDRMFLSTSGQNKSLYFNNTARYFPETLDNMQINELDRLVTSLEDYTNDPKLKRDIDQIARLFNHQVMAEQKVVSESSVRTKRIECEEPQQLSDLETARMIVTHLGLKSSLCSITSMDRISENFVDDLKKLDRQSIRTYDSVSIFYVRKNRASPREILESVRTRHNISLSFFEWLLELGQPTVVKNHSRWTGKLSNSWTNRPVIHQQKDGQENQSSASRNQMLASDHGGAIFDGERMTLYWSDMCQELAFVVPHKIDRSASNTIQIGDTNIIICWLECHDDMVNLPCDTLFAISETGHLVDEGSQVDQTEANKPKLRDHVKYLISPMRNGLYRVNLTTSFGRKWLASPLVDGMTVSKGILSSLIKESVLNLCRRRRLDADSYQPPHVKRRLKLQEICNTHKISSRYEPTEFYYNLFKSKAN